jgi:hypothetical protein
MSTKFYEEKRGVLRDEESGLPLHNHSLTDFEEKPCDCGDRERDRPQLRVMVSKKFLESVFGDCEQE